MKAQAHRAQSAAALVLASLMGPDTGTTLLAGRRDFWQGRWTIWQLFTGRTERQMVLCYPGGLVKCRQEKTIKPGPLISDQMEHMAVKRLPTPALTTLQDSNSTPKIFDASPYYQYIASECAVNRRN